MRQKAEDVNTDTHRCIVVGRVACNEWERVVQERGIGWQVVPEGMYNIEHHGLIVQGVFVKATNYSEVSVNTLKARYESRYKVESMVISFV